MLEHAGLSRARGGDTGRLHIHFTGPPDELPKGDGTYGTSIPFEYGVNPAHDVLLAYKMDFAEELDRLGSHVTEMLQVLDAKEPAGRKVLLLLRLARARLFDLRNGGRPRTPRLPVHPAGDVRLGIG